MDREVVAIAIDIEMTGATPHHSEVISVGIARPGEKTLFTFNDIAFPLTEHGPIVQWIPRMLEGEVVHPIEYVPISIDPHNKLTICDYGDFEKRCWDEFWCKNQSALLSNLGRDNVSNQKKWYAVLHTLTAWTCEVSTLPPPLPFEIVFFLCSYTQNYAQILADGKMPRIVSDNPAYDIGVVNAMLLKHSEDRPGEISKNEWLRSTITIGTTTFKHLFPAAPSLHYMPREWDPDNGPKIGYQGIGDPEVFDSAVTEEWIPEIEVKCDDRLSHNAASDAEEIAIKYTAYAAKYPRIA